MLSLTAALAVVVLSASLAACSSDSASTTSSSTGDAGPAAPGADTAGGGDGGPTSSTGAPSASVPSVALTGTACEELVPCDSDLVGTWDGTAACTNGLFEFFDAPPTSGCADFRENSVSGDVKVRYTFTETTVTRSLEGTVEENIDLPLRCVGSKLPTCADVQANIVQALYGEFSNPRPDPTAFSATCKAAGDVCNCDVTLKLSRDINDLKVGYQLQSAGTAEDAEESFFSFCRKADLLQVRTEILRLGSTAPNYATYTLTKVK